MKIKGVLETCLYAEDLESAENFYSDLPGLQLVSKESGRHIFYRCGGSMLLIFNPEHTANEQTDVNGRLIPMHGAVGGTHIAFSIDASETETWRRFLKENGIEIESEVLWPGGNISIYFRDPAGNSLEVVTAKIWER